MLLDGSPDIPVGTRSNASLLAGHRPIPATGFLITPATEPRHLVGYHALRHVEFVEQQHLFEKTDRDDVDEDGRTVVLVAVDAAGRVVGGVRLAPMTVSDLGWWSGSRLVASAQAPTGVGSALVRAACAYAESHGVLRFDATVQDRYQRLFASLGWSDRGAGPTIAGRAHREFTWPIGRMQALADGTKAVLADALAPFTAQPSGLGPTGFRGDDGAPVPGTDVIAACDAILPSMVERDPEWAGWCSVLVNLNDLGAMGATPRGLLDAVGATTRSQLTRVIRGIATAAAAWDVPVLGGHTQVGVPASLSVTALGTTDRPVPAGGGRVGDVVSLTADLSGGWRPGYTGQQWDSTSSRSPAELRRMQSLVAELSPAAAKDVSMAGIVGTLGMLAEASGTGAELDVAAIPRPAAAPVGSWLTCFPGFAMLTAATTGVNRVDEMVTSASCGRLTSSPGVRLRWPDGITTQAIASTVTGLGTA